MPRVVDNVATVVVVMFGFGVVVGGVLLHEKSLIRAGKVEIKMFMLNLRRCKYDTSNYNIKFNWHQLELDTIVSYI